VGRAGRRALTLVPVAVASAVGPLALRFVPFAFAFVLFVSLFVSFVLSFVPFVFLSPA
jgi:hypothetical protein